MRVTYNPEAPSPLIVNEIKYYMALSALKKMLADSVITSENYKKATVAIAERYRVYDTIFSGCRDSFVPAVVVVLLLRGGHNRCRPRKRRKGGAENATGTDHRTYDKATETENPGLCLCPCEQQLR